MKRDSFFTTMPPTATYLLCNPTHGSCNENENKVRARETITIGTHFSLLYAAIKVTSQTRTEVTGI
jgi:hypothetical protein